MTWKGAARLESEYSAPTLTPTQQSVDNTDDPTVQIVQDHGWSGVGYQFETAIFPLSSAILNFHFSPKRKCALDGQTHRHRESGI